jgi:hypothetical protein
MTAHRVSFLMNVGPIPDGIFVCHKCDVPACMNPDHLFLGTNADNIADKVAKGRANMRRLDYYIVARIRESDEPSTVLAERFNISKKSIHDVRNGKTWKGVRG